MDLEVTTVLGTIEFPNVPEPKNTNLYEIYKSSQLARDPELYKQLPLRHRVQIQLSNQKVTGVAYMALGFGLFGVNSLTVASLLLVGGLSTAVIAPTIGGVLALILFFYGSYQFHNSF